MRTTLKAALAVPAACALMAGTGAATAQGHDGHHEQGTYKMKLTDTMGNKSGSSSTATLWLKGDTVKVHIKGTGFTPKSPHAQHLHGSFSSGKAFTCPTPKADKDADGQVNVEEGLPMYGDIMVSLTTSGDTSKKSGLAVERMPMADAKGNLDYERTIKLPEGAGAKLKHLHIVQHGLDANDNDKYDMDALGESSFAKSLGAKGIPEEATNPATCGMVSGASVGHMPHGGVDTGNGDTASGASAAPIALGGLAFLGAGGAWMWRRQLNSAN